LLLGGGGGCLKTGERGVEQGMGLCQLLCMLLGVSSRKQQPMLPMPFL
jgi:hypothetical protein